MDSPEEDGKEMASSPPYKWPPRGTIQFRDVSAKYHQDGNDILRGVTFDTQEGEKVISILR
jgi:ABC-type bacteriocin/lantibiotic exporter with double-glycine peptidase domain